MTQPIPNPAVQFDVLYEDAGFLVIAKPAGVVSEPGLGHRDDSLMNGIFARWGAFASSLGTARDFGLVHRLDRDSSGAIIIALEASAYDALRAQFAARTVRKRYMTIVEGKPPRPEGSIELPLDEVRRGDMKSSLVDHRGGGRPANTRWKSLGSGHRRTLLDVEIETGRLHQIRAHMAELGCPVVGESVYRVDLPPITSRPPKGRAMQPLALHALTLTFAHPATGAPVTVTCPLPEHFKQVAADATIALPRELR